MLATFNHKAVLLQLGSGGHFSLFLVALRDTIMSYLPLAVKG